MATNEQPAAENPYEDRARAIKAGKMAHLALAKGWNAAQIASMTDAQWTALAQMIRRTSTGASPATRQIVVQIARNTEAILERAREALEIEEAKPEPPALTLQLEQLARVHVKMVPAGGGIEAWLDPDNDRGPNPAVKDTWVPISEGPTAGEYRVHAIDDRRLTLRCAHRPPEAPMTPEHGIHGHYVWLTRPPANQCRGCGELLDAEQMAVALDELMHRREKFSGPFCSQVCGQDHAEAIYQGVMEDRADARREDPF